MYITRVTKLTNPRIEHGQAAGINHSHSNGVGNNPTRMKMEKWIDQGELLSQACTLLGSTNRNGDKKTRVPSCRGGIFMRSKRKPGSSLRTSNSAGHGYRNP